MNPSSNLSFPTTSFGTVTIHIEVYDHNEAMAVELYDEHGEYVTVLSVNLPEFTHELGPNEFFAKTWSENEELAVDALASGIFKDTGRSKQGGFVIMPVWQFQVEPAKESFSNSNAKKY